MIKDMIKHDLSAHESMLVLKKENKKISAFKFLLILSRYFNSLRWHSHFHFQLSLPTSSHGHSSVAVTGAFGRSACRAALRLAQNSLCLALS